MIIRDFSRRKQAEENLRGALAWQEAISEGSRDAIFITGPESNITGVNAAACELTGYSRQELLKMRIPDLHEEIDLEAYRTYHDRIMAGEDILSEALILRKDGSKVETEFNNRRIVIGDVPYMHTTARDITERKRAEQAEREQRTLAEALRDSAAALSSTLDLDEVLDRILENATRVVPHHASNIMLLENQEVHVVRSRGYAERGLREWVESLRVPVTSVLTIQDTVLDGPPYVIQDTLAFPNWLRLPETDWIRSHLGAPVRIGGTVVGILNLDDEKPGFFTDADADKMQAFADQVAVAIRNALLYEESDRRAQEFAALYETASDLATVQDLSALLQTIVKRAVSLVHSASGTIDLYDSARQDLEVVVAQGVGLSIGTRFQLGEGLAGRAAQNHEPIIVDDYQAWEHRALAFAQIPFRAILELPMLHRGELIGILAVHELGDSTRKFTQKDARLLSLFAGQAASAVYITRLLDETSIRAQQLGLLYDAGLALNSMLEPRAQLEFLFQIAIKALHADRAEFFRSDLQQGALVFELGVGHSREIKAKMEVFTFPADGESGIIGWVSQNRIPLNLPDLLADPRYVRLDPDVRSGLWVPVEHQHQLRGVLSILSIRPNAFTSQDERLLTLFANQAAVALENARLFEETRQRLAELEAINRVSAALREAQTLDEMLPRLLDETLYVLGTTAGTIWLETPAGEHETKEISRGWFEQVSAYPPEGEEGLAFYIRKTGQPYMSSDLKNDPQVRNAVRPAIPEHWSGGCIPLRASNETVGALFIALPPPRVLNDNEIHLLMTLAEIAGNTIQRMRLNERTGRQVRYLAALHTIDVTISASLDLRFSLDLILDQVIKELAVDAADVLLFKPQTQTLEFAAGRGFRTESLKYTRLRPGEGLAGRAALERRMINLPDLAIDADGLVRSKALPGERFVAYYAAPLIAKGQVKGVLEILHRSPLNPDPEWLGYLDALATQLAIAIDGAELFADLQRSNAELAIAYDTTLEGWSRALDLRDKETEGHTERVTRLAERLARAMGVADNDLAQIRRGALLHDIGKMGIPDSILFKPGPLTPEEWTIMRLHPEYAHELLLPVPYLRPALDIPYCHHEKWDGTGYPRGLKGEDIPLAARIFAIVDVWDALRSDRPYRGAWRDEQVYKHLLDQSGTHFDPKVVKAFLELMEAESER